MIERLVKNNQTELPALFEPPPVKYLTLEQMQELLAQINIANEAHDYNVLINALNRIKFVLENELKCQNQN